MSHFFLLHQSASNSNPVYIQLIVYSYKLRVIFQSAITLTFPKDVNTFQSSKPHNLTSIFKSLPLLLSPIKYISDHSMVICPENMVNYTDDSVQVF